MTPTLPQNLEAEEALLYRILVRSEYSIDYIMSSDLTDDCFYTGRCRTLFECIEILYREQHPIDMVSLCEVMERENKKGAEPYDVARIFEVRTVTEAPELIQMLLRCRWRRQGILTCQQAVQKLYQEVVMPDEVLNTTADLLQKIPMTRHVEHTTLNDVNNTVLCQIDDNLNPETRHHGTATGFAKIDETGGLPEVGVTVIAADTGQGKSSLGIDLAMQNLRDGEKVGYFSLEMPQEDLARRILSSMTGIPSYRLAYDPLSDEEQQRANQAAMEIVNTGGDRFFFDNRMESGVDGIIATIRRLADPRGKRVTHFYVDYMQILSWADEGPARHRASTVEQFLASAARAFHNISVQLKVQIVLLSQVNRDTENREPTLDRIRDSKQIADAATCVILLYRPEAYQRNYQREEFKQIDPRGTALIDVAKRRNGPRVAFIVGFDERTTHFYPLNDNPQPITKFYRLGI